MATFASWWKSQHRDRLKRVTWICGKEPALRLVAIRGLTPALAEKYLFVLPLDSEKSLWDHLDQSPQYHNFTMIYGAETITDLDRLNKFLELSVTNTYGYVMFDSSDQKVIESTELRKQKHRVIQAKTPNPEDAHSIVLAHCPPDTTGATVSHLLARTGGDLTEALSVAYKASVLGKLDARITDALTSERASRSFIEALTCCDRRTAALATGSVTETPLVLTVLMKRLDLLEQTKELLSQGMERRYLPKYLPPQLIQLLIDNAAQYDQSSLTRRRTLVAEASGARGNTGALEILTARW